MNPAILRIHPYGIAKRIARPLRVLVTCIFGCGALALVAPLLQGQVNTGSLTGHITDPSGAAVHGASLALKNNGTAYERNVASDDDGNYFLSDLPIGNYTLTATAPGFATQKIEETINVGFRSRTDVQFNVGSEKQTVEVTANTSDLSRDDASISTIVGNETISDTPLFLRNWDDLLRTVPGVQINRYTNQSGATSSGRVGSFNVNGVHSLQNNFILDGIDNNTFSENVQELSTEAAHPSVDVIAQFNVITNPYSAEYGRAPGAVVSVNTNSGTNAYHGTAYEYVRNQYFDAFDYFSKQTLAKKAQDNQDQFGAITHSSSSILKTRASSRASRASPPFRWTMSASVTSAPRLPRLRE